MLKRGFFISQFTSKINIFAQFNKYSFYNKDIIINKFDYISSCIKKFMFQFLKRGMEIKRG